MSEQPYTCNILKRYRLLQVVGRGAHGVANLAEPPDDTSERVVVKQIFSYQKPDPTQQGETDFILAAKSEVNILAMLQHPNVIRFMDSDSYYIAKENTRVLVLVMEYANYGNLHEYLESHADTPLPNEILLSFASQLCLALHYIHSQRVLHRDLKSHNVLLHKHSRNTITLKLADFGISKLFLGGSMKAETVLGTPNYLSPELCRGESYNEKSDIWAMGCILYELTTRKFMFDGSNMLAIIKKITERVISHPIPLDQVPSWLHELIDAMTTLDPDARINTKSIVDLPGIQLDLAQSILHEYDYAFSKLKLP